MEVIEVIDTQIEVIQITEREVEVVEVIEQGPQGEGVQVLTTQGDIVYRGSSAVQRLAIGTAGQFLSVNTGATAPEWATITKSTVGLSNVDNTSDANKPVSTATQTALNLKANLASPTFTGTVSGITKSMVGLSNVDNTSDANKPISSATQTALDGKASSAAGVPAGGTTGQVLRKKTNTSYDTEWGTGGVTYGTTAGTACEGNDGRISGIGSGTINTLPNDFLGNGGLQSAGTITTGFDNSAISPSQIKTGTKVLGSLLLGGYIDTRGLDEAGGSIDTHGGTASGGSIDTHGGTAIGGSINTSNGGGSINTAGGQTGFGGQINTSNGGGNIYTGGYWNSGDEYGTAGGTINTTGGEGGGGGSILMYGGENDVGGSITTYDGGGSINTRGTGSIELGQFGTRTTLTGTATSPRAISLPDADGTLATEDRVTNSVANSGIIAGQASGLWQPAYNQVGLYFADEDLTLVLGNGTILGITPQYVTAPRVYNLPNATGTLALTEQAIDYEVTDATKGIILKSPNNSRWRITIDNDGNLSSTKL